MPFGHRLGLHHVGVFRWLFLLVLVALVVVGVIALTRSWSSRRPGLQTGAFGGPGGSWPPTGPRTDPALEELRIRYARGELSWEEYSQRAANLGYAAGPVSKPGGDPHRAPGP